MRKALSIDIGGTKIYNALVDENGQIISEVEKHSTPDTVDEIKSLLKNIISQYENDVDVIAIATAGAVNKENSAVISSTGNLPSEYRNIDFQSLSNKKVFLENDANSAAWAEHVLGASKGCSDSVMLTLGTGVGGGIIVNDRLLKGKSGAAGEMHFKLSTEKQRRCTCGAYDCFEAYASGTGLQTTAREKTRLPNITTYDVIEEVKTVLKLTKIHEGTKSVTERLQLAVEDCYIDAFLKWQNDIIDGCIGLADIFDPSVIVLSGSMAQFVDISYVENAVNREIVTMPVKVKLASTGNYSGMIGAALLAMGVGVNNEVSC